MRTMKRTSARRRIYTAAVTASVAWTAGCGIDTEVVGVVADKDVVTLDLMIPLARGQNSELGDVFAATAYVYITASGTDEMTNGGTGNDDIRFTVGQYHQRPAGAFAQATEGAWSGVYAAERITAVDLQNGVDPQADPLIARMWLNAGLAERQLGEQFCEAVFNYGPDGGILLENEGNYDPGVVVDADSVFRRVVTFAELALAQADRAIAAGSPTPDDWYLFDPEVIRTSSHGLLAQAYAALGDWTMADQYAAMVPVDHVEYTHMNPDAEENDVYDEGHQDDDLGVWGTPAHLLWEGDPRVPFVHCGEYQPGVEPGSTTSPSAFMNLTNNPGCEMSDGVQNEYRLENNLYPRYAQMKYTSQDDDMEMVTGTEMLLIRAEAALNSGDLVAFTAHIDDLRAYYGLAPITQPTTAGALEYPNTEDDAWSILDRERYLELWLEGRRFFDMRRWEHPFWSEGHYLTPTAAMENPPGPRPFSCLPLPDDECGTNPLIRESAPCAPLPPPGG